MKRSKKVIAGLLLVSIMIFSGCYSRVRVDSKYGDELFKLRIDDEWVYVNSVDHINDDGSRDIIIHFERSGK